MGGVHFGDPLGCIVQETREKVALGGHKKEQLVVRKFRFPFGEEIGL
jgi:hypothetical protein